MAGATTSVARDHRTREALMSGKNTAVFGRQGG